MKTNPIPLSANLFLFQDACNVYVIRDGDRAIAIDFGSGAWLGCLPSLGIVHLDHVLLTHHHADQCFGLKRHPRRRFIVHAPVGEDKFLDSRAMKAHGTFDGSAKTCPNSYMVLKQGLRGVRYDMAPAADLFWGRRRVRFLSTPGHSPHACSVIADVDGRQVVFCGDAAHAGATIWQPYHLEWDHCTGGGALAAWEGVARLGNVAIDLLCSAHGPVVDRRPRQMLSALAKKLLRLYEVKGSICAGEPDRYLEPEVLSCGAHRLLSDLYQFGCNGYLLRSTTGEALVVDPWLLDMPALHRLLAKLPGTRITAASASHYHSDHSDGLPYLKEHFGTRSILHPWVAAPLQGRLQQVVPWNVPAPLHIDKLWPEQGSWQWNEYRFQIAPLPGQTWWHCGFMTTINGRRVAFTGDSFQPASRWNGTGGFCAFNVSRFQEGFIHSAHRLLAWNPDLCAAGHGTCYAFSPRYFRKVIAWAKRAEKAVQALCPSQNLERDYYALAAAARKRTPQASRGELYWLRA